MENDEASMDDADNSKWYGGTTVVHHHHGGYGYGRGGTTVVHHHHGYGYGGYGRGGTTVIHHHHYLQEAAEEPVSGDEEDGENAPPSLLEEDSAGRDADD